MLHSGRKWLSRTRNTITAGPFCGVAGARRSLTLAGGSSVEVAAFAEVEDDGAGQHREPVSAGVGTEVVGGLDELVQGLAERDGDGGELVETDAAVAGLDAAELGKADAGTLGEVVQRPAARLTQGPDPHSDGGV